MRTTWLILLIMVLAGGAMYYMATRPKVAAPYDTIALHDTPDSIRSKLRVFAAYDPTDITYRDSAWFQQDSIPLKEIALDTIATSFDKNYKSVTFYLDYDHAWFYDVEVNKPAQDVSYQISFAVNKLKDSLRVSGIINDPLHDQLRLSGPMMKMYSSFILTYSNKLPPSTDTTQHSTRQDSARQDSIQAGKPVTPPRRVITVVKK
jgi:hypothetical protein